MATARFSPRDGAPLPCLLSEIGERVSRVCEAAVAQIAPFDREGNVDLISLRRAIGEAATFDLDEYGILASVDAFSLTLLPSCGVLQTEGLRQDDLDERIELR
jgi:hypothetical protein